MSQEPWNDEIYKSDEKSRKSRSGNGSGAIKIFTILAVLFLVIVTAIVITAIYLSSGGSNTDSTKEFYNPRASSSVSSSSNAEIPAETTVEAAAEETTAEANTTEDNAEPGTTLTVQPGEGEASIAARAGISIAELERLNPEKMTTGSWLAHPGDTVRIK